MAFSRTSQTRWMSRKLLSQSENSIRKEDHSSNVLQPKNRWSLTKKKKKRVRYFRLCFPNSFQTHDELHCMCISFRPLNILQRHFRKGMCVCAVSSSDLFFPFWGRLFKKIHMLTTCLTSVLAAILFRNLSVFPFLRSPLRRGGYHRESWWSWSAVLGAPRKSRAIIAPSEGNEQRQKRSFFSFEMRA